VTDAYWYAFINGRNLDRFGKIATLKTIAISRWQAEDIYFPLQMPIEDKTTKQE